MTISYQQFYQNNQDIVRRTDRQGDIYFQEHSQRFYQTYLTCASLLKHNQKMLSVGAGSAYVEFQLKHALNVDVTVIDFPEAIQSHSALYSEFGFKTVGLDLSQPWVLPQDVEFNLILSGEVIEHIPAAPIHHIQALSRYLLSGGYMVVTTPNLARFMTIVRLLRNKPVAAAPELIFGPVDYKHEFVHRREYVASEIHNAFNQAGLTPHHTSYTRNSAIHTLTPRKLAAKLIEAINPRFRETMILVARRDD